MKTLFIYFPVIFLLMFLGCKTDNLSIPISDDLGHVKNGIIYFDSHEAFHESYNNLKNAINPINFIAGYDEFVSAFDYYENIDLLSQTEDAYSEIYSQDGHLFKIEEINKSEFEIMKSIRSPYFSRLVNSKGFIGIQGILYLIQYDFTYFVTQENEDILVSMNLNSPLVTKHQNKHIEVSSNTRVVCTNEGNPACVSGNNRRVRTALTVTNLLAFAAIDSQVKAQKKNGIGFWVEETTERLELNSDVTFTESGSPGCPCTVTDIFNQVVLNNDEIHHEIVSYGGTPIVTYSVNDAVVRGEMRKCTGTFIRECTIIVN